MQYCKPDPKDLVVVKFPFILGEKGEIQKGRPAMVLSDDNMARRYRDIILAAITSNIPQDIMEPEMILEPLESTGLAKRSLLRLDFIMTIPEELISRKIGELQRNLEKEVEYKLKKLFRINGT